MVRHICSWVKSTRLALFILFLRFIKKLLTNAKIGVADLHGQVGGQVVHQSVSQLWIGIAQHDQFVTRDDK